jgi:hypothetical protein
MSKREGSNRKRNHLTDAQNAKLRQVVQDELCSRVPTQLHLAPFLHIAQGNLSKFLDGQLGGSAALALRVASLLNRSVEEVLGVEPVPEFIDRDERRYPSRILAARAAYLDGVPLDHIRAVLSSSLHHDGDPGPVWWLKMMSDGDLARPGNKRDTARALKAAQPPGWTKATPKKTVKRRKPR